MTGVELLDAALPAPARGVFTTRAGGVSAPPWSSLNLALHTDDEWRRVHANRDLLARAIGLSYRELVFGRQVHGTGVRLVQRSSSNARDRGLRDTDGLVTTSRGVALVIMGADCLPALRADPVARLVAAAHVGRQGLVDGVVAELLTVMASQGARPDRTAARVGPGICGSCYEVPPALAAQADATAPGSRGRTRTGTASVDLTAGATGQLHAAGVVDVRTSGGCTLEQPERFFSYRRDGPTGRHAGVVWLP
jgi:YfiH family protein